MSGIVKRAAAKNMHATKIDLMIENLRIILLLTRSDRFRFELATYMKSKTREIEIKKRLRQ